MGSVAPGLWDLSSMTRDQIHILCIVRQILDPHTLLCKAYSRVVPGDNFVTTAWTILTETVPVLSRYLVLSIDP